MDRAHINLPVIWPAHYQKGAGFVPSTSNTEYFLVPLSANIKMSRQPLLGKVNVCLWKAFD